MSTFTIKLITGDNSWTENGTHECDELGYVKIVEKPIIITFNDEETYNRVLSIIHQERGRRGLDNDGNRLPTDDEIKEEETEKQNDNLLQLTNEISQLKETIREMSDMLASTIVSITQSNQSQTQNTTDNQSSV